jgi:hypothetical protein
MISPAEVGRAIGKSRRSAKALLRAAGVLEQLDNGRWYVGETRLRERLPDVYDRVYAAFALAPATVPKSDR